MSLAELIAGVEAHEKTLTVFNTEPSTADALRERFADRNVRVRTGSTASGHPAEFVTLSDDERVYTATDLETLFERLDGRERPLSGGRDDSILDHLDETLFTSWSVDRMVAASREIEDRAWRVGAGSLHAGFQTLSTLEVELDRYERLGESDIDVHTYAVPDIEPPRNTTFRLHLDRSEEIATSWFVVFDDESPGGESAGDGSTGDGSVGGGSAAGGSAADGTTQNCALLAEEREPGSFYGFWTYDAATVDWVVEHLESRYGVVTR